MSRILTATNENHSLELKIHQRILSDIASIDQKSDEDINHAQHLIASKVRTRATRQDRVAGAEDGPKLQQESTRVYMVSSSWMLPAILAQELRLLIAGIAGSLQYRIRRTCGELSR